MRRARSAMLAAHAIVALAFLLPGAPAASRGQAERGVGRGAIGPGAGRRAPASIPEEAHPSPEPLLTVEQLRSRMLSLLEDPAVVHVTLQAQDGPVAGILFRDRDETPWNLLIAGIRTAQPGIPAPGEPKVILKVSCRDAAGKWTFEVLGFEGGMLGLDDRDRGGMIPTLQVGPGFLEGLEQILQATGTELPQEPTESSYAEPSMDHGELRYHQLLQAAPVGREQALAVAKRFAADFGLPLGGEPQALFFPDEKLGTAGSWLIRNRGFAQLTVDAREGCVMRAQNSSASLENMYTPTPVKLTRQQALDKAARVTIGMGLAGASLSTPSPRFLDKRAGLGSAWRVTWQHLLDGIPVHHDAALVVLDAGNGALLHASRSFAPPPPDSTTVAIDGSRAADLALQMAPDIFGAEDVALRGEPTLHIVRPNYAFDPAERDRHRSDPVNTTRLAWVVPLRTGEREAEIWLDAADASVLGGIAEGPSPHPPPSGDLAGTPTVSDAAGRTARGGGARGGGGRRGIQVDAEPEPSPRSATLLFTALAAFVVLILIIAAVLIHERRAARRPPAPE